MVDLIFIPVSAGELLDRITILEIKNEHIDVSSELQALEGIADEELALWRESEILVALRSVNRGLWGLEDEVRSDLGEDFIPSARDIARLNDKRAAVKHEASDKYRSQVKETAKVYRRNE